MKDVIKDKTISYILAGFGLVAGLAWNDAIRSFIEYVFPLEKNSLVAKLIYAVILTFVLVFISVYLTEIFKKEEKKPEECAKDKDRDNEGKEEEE